MFKVFLQVRFSPVQPHSFGSLGSKLDQSFWESSNGWLGSGQRFSCTVPRKIDPTCIPNIPQSAVESSAWTFGSYSVESMSYSVEVLSAYTHTLQGYRAEMLLCTDQSRTRYTSIYFTRTLLALTKGLALVPEITPHPSTFNPNPRP